MSAHHPLSSKVKSSTSPVFWKEKGRAVHRALANKTSSVWSSCCFHFLPPSLPPSLFSLPPLPSLPYSVELNVCVSWFCCLPAAAISQHLLQQTVCPVARNTSLTSKVLTKLMHSWMKIMKRAVHGLMWCAHLYVHLLIHTYSILVCWALLTGTLLTSENMILCPCQVKVLPNGGKEQTVNKHIRCLQWQHPTSGQGSVVTKCRWVESNNQKGLCSQPLLM